MIELSPSAYRIVGELELELAWLFLQSLAHYIKLPLARTHGVGGLPHANG